MIAKYDLAFSALLLSSFKIFVLFSTKSCINYGVTTLPHTHYIRNGRRFQVLSILFEPQLRLGTQLGEFRHHLCKLCVDAVA